MTDTERISFLQAHCCTQFLAEEGHWVVQMGTGSPLTCLDGNGASLGEAIDDCKARNYDANGRRLHFSLHIDDENAPSAPRPASERPKPCLEP